MDVDILKFHLYRAADGRTCIADLYRRNGQAAVIVRQVELEPPADDTDAFERHRDRLAKNLTPIEERRWRKLLDGYSIEQLAHEEGISRAAIYECIRGKGGRGGMVRKNRWVRAWWNNRQLVRLA